METSKSNIVDRPSDRTGSGPEQLLRGASGVLAAAVFAGVSLFSFASCTAVGAPLKYTSAIDQPLGEQENGGLKIYTTEAPPYHYKLKGVVTVEHKDKGRRYAIARGVAVSRGGDALIAKPEKRETVNEVIQSVDLGRQGGFAIKRKNRTVVIQDFLIIARDERPAAPAAMEPSPPVSPPVMDQGFSSSPPVSDQDQPTANEPFQDNGDGTVQEVGKNLVWQKCSAGQNFTGSTCEGQAETLDVKGGEEYCQKLQLGGRRWRLPSRDELVHLIDRSTGSGKSGQALAYRNSFPATAAGSYWTASSYSREGNLDRYVVDFSDGTGYAYYRENRAAVRCVSSQ